MLGTYTKVHCMFIIIIIVIIIVIVIVDAVVVDIVIIIITFKLSLIFSLTGNACFKKSLPLSEVFAVVPQNIKANQSTEGEIELTSLKSSSFCVYAVKRTRKHKWRDKTFLFDCDDASLCQEWIESIQNILSGK